MSTYAQKNFFETIEANGPTMAYQGFSAKTAKGDGTYDFGDTRLAVTLSVTKMSDGTPVGFKAIYVEKEQKGAFGQNATSDYGTADHVVEPMYMYHNRDDDGYLMLDDLLLTLYDIPSDGNLTMDNVGTVYVAIKERSKKEDTGKKKKGGFMAKMKAKLKAATGGSPEYAYLNKENLDQRLADYVKAMNSKQSAVSNAKESALRARLKASNDNENLAIRKYNDSIKATPEYIDLQRRIKQNENNYQASKTKNSVTLRNNTGNTIYVGKSGSRNPGTKITSGGTASWNCDADGYLQTITKSGGSNAYSSTNRKVYSANSGCGDTVTIN